MNDHKFYGGVFVLIVLLGGYSWWMDDVDAKAIRSRAPLLEFRKANICPATGKLEIYTPCPGYVIDHVMPLCAGGRDAPDNMRWQEYKASKAKDILEMEICRKMKKECVK